MISTDKSLFSKPGNFDGGGLYVHVAYCRSKCIYCDFFSAGDRMADWRGYVDALGSEFKNRKDELAWPLRTVYFGGGTPSLMPENEFSRLCSILRPYMAMVEEFTIEVNPDDVDENKLEFWKREGVNRVSIGIQTFHDASLKAIGRRHDSQTAVKAYELARKYFDNVSIDLMFGLPGQSLDVWRDDVRKALDLHPEHISAYSLMYEEGTPLTVLRDNGRIHEAPEELSERMFLLLIEELSAAGYDHYEISNFALPGFRSRHNSSYWLQKPYIGLGPSAHSYDGLRKRKANMADIRGYIACWTSHGQAASLIDTEILTDDELLDEYVLTRMRMREGIPLADYCSRFGEKALSVLLNKGKKLAEEGLVKLTEDNISLTEKAIFLSDSVILRLSGLY